MNNTCNINGLNFYCRDEAEKEACRRLSADEKPTSSLAVCGLTVGYGELDHWGYWEFPLILAPDTNKG